MHSKGGQPGHTCAHGWSSHILFIPSRMSVTDFIIFAGEISRWSHQKVGIAVMYLDRGSVATGNFHTCLQCRGCCQLLASKECCFLYVMYCHARSCHVISCAAMSCSCMCINTCSGSVILWSIIGCVGYLCKLTWLVLGGDPAARSHRVEQFTAL